ncbi:HRDC domain-containing protein [Methanobrevibacter arboriphilus]|uniref:HRDC domain-containing protein n=1 Tax=Methanobrevibacter arboriphilus TaxID=39441 RepID=UPI000B18407B|nr:HRDC domain-containing protein [Methanobrevibacter arboriphilus]
MNKIDNNNINNVKINNDKIDKNKIDKSKTDKNKIDKSSQGNQNNDILFEKLRKLRLKLARDKNIPPFMIFHDSTLKKYV